MPHRRSGDTAPASSSFNRKTGHASSFGDKRRGDFKKRAGGEGRRDDKPRGEGARRGKPGERRADPRDKRAGAPGGENSRDFVSAPSPFKRKSGYASSFGDKRRDDFKKRAGGERPRDNKPRGEGARRGGPGERRADPRDKRASAPGGENSRDFVSAPSPFKRKSGNASSFGDKRRDDFKKRAGGEYSRDNKPRGEGRGRRAFGEKRIDPRDKRPDASKSEKPRDFAPAFSSFKRKAGYVSSFDEKGGGDFKKRPGEARFRDDRPRPEGERRRKPEERRINSRDKRPGAAKSENSRDFAPASSSFKRKTEHGFSFGEKRGGDFKKRPDEARFRNGKSRGEGGRYGKPEEKRIDRNNRKKAAPPSKKPAENAAVLKTPGGQTIKLRPSSERLTDQTPAEDREGERVAKFIARAGIASRRDIERFITEGNVSVNGETLKTPAFKVTEDDIILVNGVIVKKPEETRLWVFHKPRGCVTSAYDPEGRQTVFDVLPEDMPRVITVGRLDYNSEGLLLLTNDGALSRRLELPANGFNRRYRVRVFGDVRQKDLDMLAKGVTVDGVKYAPAFAELDKKQGANAWLTVSLTEGKNREIRKLAEYLGYTVNRLIRVGYGPFRLGALPEGGVKEFEKSYFEQVLKDAEKSAA